MRFSCHGTFKMIAIHSASVLPVVKPKQTGVTAAVRSCTRPDPRYISYRHDLYSNTDKHNPSLRVNSSITNTTQSNMADSKKKISIFFSFSFYLLFSSSCSERSLHEKALAFQIQNIYALLGLCVRSVFVESALGAPEDQGKRLLKKG